MLNFLKKFVASDKTILVAAICQGAASLVARFGLHMGGDATAVLSALVAAALGYFVSGTVKAKLAAAK